MTDFCKTCGKLIASCSLGCIVLGMAISPAVAQQQLTVQQPSFETFSGATTVSVPDRGRTVIGGVSRGASGTSNYGPFRSGINSGRAFSGSSVSAHVRIHDFAEMDRQILDSASDQRTLRHANGSGGNDIRLADHSEHAYQVLRNGSAASTRTTGPATPSVPERRTAAADSDRDADGAAAASAAEAERLFQKGRRAQAAGNSEVARVWFRLAEQHGSAPAAAELRRTDPTRVAAKK